MVGAVEDLSPAFLITLNQLEHDCGFTLRINSGLRQPDHNASVGGVSDSAHLPDENGVGHAADLDCPNSWQRLIIVKKAIALGINRIGIGKTFIHVDDSVTLPQNVCWTYYP